jgi:hypothetical protein
MRLFVFMPLAYISGIEGFGWFVPYVLFICSVAAISRLIQKRAARPALIPLPAIQGT